MEKQRSQYLFLFLFLIYFVLFCAPFFPVQAEEILLLDSFVETGFSSDALHLEEAVSSPSAAFSEDSFSGNTSFHDIGSHWAENGIKSWEARQMVGGYPDGTFRTDHRCRYWTWWWTGLYE